MAKFILSNRKRFWLLLSSVVTAVILIATFFWSRQSAAADFITAKLARGNLRNAVSATGTLQAVTTVQVGSQVSGTIKSLFADFNSEVRQGQIVTQLDPAIFQAQLAQQRANLEQARANLANAQARVLSAEAAVETQRSAVTGASANLAALKAQRDDAQSFLDRQTALIEDGIINARDLETARTAFRAADERYNQAAAQLEQARVAERTAANAGLAQARAEVQQSQAQVRQTEAAVHLAEVNLSHTTIRSPIDGVVVSRNVDVGQTVAASLQAPTLFTIANDLTAMQVIANIDQADIGLIVPTARAAFTVDAFPGQQFKGQIRQLRINPQTVQNVVTYNVVLDVENPELKLKPGMTANLTIIIAERANVLRVPNAALRFLPSGVTQEKVREMLGGTGERQRGPATSAILEGQTRIVWTLGADRQPQALKIKLGITDGVHTEITEGEVKEGDLVITGQNISGASPTTTQRSPFSTQPTGGGPRMR